MKHTPNFLLLIIVILAAYGCGKKDASLLDMVPASPIVNPDTRVLIKDNALVYAELGSSGIRGLNRTHVFTTPDGFQSFTIRPYTPDNNLNRYKVSGNRIIYWNTQTPTPFTYSLDFGQSWQTIRPEIEGAWAALGDFYGLVEDVRFIDDNSLLLFTKVSQSTTYYNQYSHKTNIYKVDLRTRKGTLFSAIGDYHPVAIKFLDQNTGWVSLIKPATQSSYYYNNPNVYIAKTSDGGLTWSTPVWIHDGVAMTLALGSDGYLFFYNSNGLKYASTNGVNWSKLPTSPRLSDVVVLNAATLFAVAEGGFMKSTDGGTTWNFQSEKDKDRYRYGKISFRNEKEGIIYQDQSMFQTTDGGATWQPLLHPYPYIIN